MKSRSKLYGSIVLVCVMVCALSYTTYAEVNVVTAVQSTTSPRAEMEATLEKLVQAVEKLPGEENLSKRRAQMREVITPKFDFPEMAKRSLGAQWKKCTAEEQAEFVKVFSSLLAKTYIGRIESIERGMVTVVSEKVRRPKALVKTVVAYKGETFPLDYKLIYRAEAWRVYDVIIENIGLVANYRNEFAGIIRAHKFAGLMNKLQKKLVS